MYCTKCGAEIKGTSKFCPKCGNEVNYSGNITVHKTEKSSKTAILLWSLVGVLCLIAGICVAVFLFATNEKKNKESVGEVSNKKISEDSKEENEPVLTEAKTEDSFICTTESLNPTDFEWLLKETKTYDDKNTFLGSSSYSYNDENKLTLFEMFNADGSLNLKKVYTYDEKGRQKECQTWYGDGSKGEYTEYVHYDDGEMVDELFWYTADDKVHHSIKYIYNAGVNDGTPVAESFQEFNAKGEPVNEKIFEFNADGTKKNFNYYYTDGRLYESGTFEYDENGNEIKSVTYDAKGAIKEVKFYSYENNNKVSEEKRDSEGRITLWNSMKYDSANNEVLRYHYNEFGEVLNRVDSFYEPVLPIETEIIEAKNGNFLYTAEAPVTNFYLWFPQTADSLTFSKTIQIKVNDSETTTLTLESSMKKITLETPEGTTKVVIDLLDENGNVVNDTLLLPEIRTER